MNEKEMFLKIKEREFKTTVRVLKAYPEDKLSWQPHDKSKTAAQLAMGFPGEEQVGPMALAGKIDFSKIVNAEMPKTIDEVIAAYQKYHDISVAAITAASEQDLNKEIPFGPMKMRVIDVLWGMLFDLVHHRGQFSVYIRMAGGKIPSIYGPTADEPWDGSHKPMDGNFNL